MQMNKNNRSGDGGQHTIHSRSNRMTIHGLNFPDPILYEIAARLDAWSRISLCRTCTRLNSPACNAWFKRLTIDWNSRPKPSLAWPKNAPPVETLVLVGPRDRLCQSGLLDGVKGFVLEASAEQGVEFFAAVTSLYLQGWEMRGPSGPEDLLTLLSHASPHVTDLTLDHCTGVDMLVSQLLPKHMLQHLTGLHLHNAQPAEPGAAYHPPQLLLPGLSGMTWLTSLSVVTPHTFQVGADVSPLAALVWLQQLELALPALKLTGLGAIGQACTQLTQLRFVCLSEEGTGGPDISLGPCAQLRARGEVVAWPHLVEAHVLVPSDLLLQLGLHSQLTAPSLQRLHLHIIHTCSYASGNASATRTESARALHALSSCRALQQPVGITPSVKGLVRELESLAPLADKLQHLVLRSPHLEPTDTPDRVLPALAALPQLTRLTLSGADPRHMGAGGFVSLLVAMQQVKRVTIGLETQVMGSSCGLRVPVPQQLQAWGGVLCQLMQATKGSSSSLQGQQQQPAAAAAAAPRARPAALATPPTTPRVATTAHAETPPDGLAASTPPPPPPLHVYFGMWCPASDINQHALQHNPHHQQLRQLAGQSSSSTAPAGRFRLHECDVGSASDMALGADRAWLEPHYERLLQLWQEQGQWLEEEEAEEEELLDGQEQHTYNTDDSEDEGL